MFAVLTYHYGFTIKQIGELSMRQVRQYTSNLGYVLGEKKSDDKVIDVTKDKEGRAAFESLLKRNNG